MALNSLMIEVGELQENTYVLWKEGSTDAIVFDPGDEPDRIDAAIKSRGLACAALVLTHCHGDHIGALTPMKERYPAAPIYCPEAEEEWLERPTLNLSYFFGHSITGPKPEHLVKDADALALAGLSLKAIHVPGHSPGSTGYFVELAGEAPHLFGGDILFRGSIGRTDLPGGEGEEVLVSGIREKLFVLADNTIVHPGHGPETTIGREKISNPYCGEDA